MLIIGIIAAILVGSPTCGNATYASNIQQRQASADKYLPQNTTKYDTCIGGMESPNNNKSG